MTIDQALEIMSTFTFASKTIPRNDVNDALQLGIDALKRFKYARNHPSGWELDLLPGESKD